MSARNTGFQEFWIARRGSTSPKVIFEIPAIGYSRLSIRARLLNRASHSGMAASRQAAFALRAVHCHKTFKGLYSVLTKLPRIPMRYSTQIKPISYLKANAAEVLQELADQRQPMVITQNGEAKAVLQDVASYEQTQETLALLKILALGNQQLAQGRVTPIADVAKRIRAAVATQD